MKIQEGRRITGSSNRWNNLILFYIVSGTEHQFLANVHILLYYNQEIHLVAR
jgi:hypothetical protein